MEILEIKNPLIFAAIKKYFCGSIFHRTDMEGKMYIKGGVKTMQQIKAILLK